MSAKSANDESSRSTKATLNQGMQKVEPEKCAASAKNL
jgi:hypothetical protein